MKKLLIGCGILVLLVLGGVGFLTYKIYPAARALYESIESSTVAMEGLDEQFPYDAETAEGFDEQRFAQALQMRTGLRAQMRLVVEVVERAEREETGTLESITNVFDAISVAVDGLVATLRNESMGPTEFSHHMLTYWAAASSAAAGGGDAGELAGLIHEFETFKKLYAEVRAQDESLIPLEQRLSTVDEAFSAAAREYLATQPAPPPVNEDDLAFEVMLLQLSDPSVFMATSDGSMKVRVETSR